MDAPPHKTDPLTTQRIPFLPFMAPIFHDQVFNFSKGPPLGPIYTNFEGVGMGTFGGFGQNLPLKGQKFAKLSNLSPSDNPRYELDCNRFFNC